MKNNKHLIIVAGEATHRNGNVIDLVWSNKYTTAPDSKECNFTSDHMTKTGLIQAKRCANFWEAERPIHVSDKNPDQFAEYVKVWLKLGPLGNTNDTENQVSDFLRVLGDAVRTVGHRSPKITGRIALGWNLECAIKFQHFKRFQD